MQLKNKIVLKMELVKMAGSIFSFKRRKLVPNLKVNKSEIVTHTVG